MAVCDKMNFGRIGDAPLESVEKQGIPASMGWRPGGNWAGMGMFYAFQPLILNWPEKVADILYAAANHASRVGTWVEEQSLVGELLKLAGDQPHGFAAAMMVHLPAAVLAHERLRTIHLLGAVPREWLKAGAVNRLDRQRLGTEITLSLTVSADGRTATLDSAPIARADAPPKITLHAARLAAAGIASRAPSTADKWCAARAASYFLPAAARSRFSSLKRFQSARTCWKIRTCCAERVRASARLTSAS